VLSLIQILSGLQRLKVYVFQHHTIPGSGYKCLVLVSHEKGIMGILVDIALEERPDLEGLLRSNASVYMLPTM
jgi:hypothetical protein